MGRTVAILWHALFSAAAGVLYFFCVLPRWYELMGDMPRMLGLAGRVACGVLIGLAALPVVLRLLRTRKPEFGTPQLALSLRTWSIVGHVLAGVLIVGTAISEIWLSLDTAGQWLFGIYGGAAAVAVLAILAFYLSFVAELPPPPPKPIKPKKPKQRRLRRKKSEQALQAQAEEAEIPAEGASEDETATDDEQPAPVTEPEATAGSEEGAASTSEAPADEEPSDDAEASDEADTVAAERGRLRNRRPTGKSTTSRRRRRSRGGVAVED